MYTTNYTYGQIYHISRDTMFILSLLCFLVGNVFLFSGIFDWLNTYDFAALGKSILYFVGFSIWTPIIYVGLVCLYVDISVDEAGINLPFVFNTIRVKWSDIADVKTASSFMGLPSYSKVSIVITNSGLTPFHRLYGLLYGDTRQPSFLISSKIQGYRELMQAIDFHTKTKNKES